MSPLLLDRDTRSRLALDRADEQRALRTQERSRRLQEEQEHRDRSTARRRRAQATRARWRTATHTWLTLLPSRLILVPATLAAAAAWRGQEDWARTGLGWSTPWAVGLATALETLGFSLAAMARSARNDEDTAIVERLAMWGIVASAAYLNWAHSHQPVLGLMSISGVAGWEVYERRRHRHAKRASRPAKRPAFGLARWLRYPAWTFRAWSIAIRDRLSATDAVTALELARGERSAVRLLRGRQGWARQVRVYIDAERARAMEHAGRVLAESEELLGAAGLLFGPEKLKSLAEGAPGDPVASEPQGHPETPVPDVEPPGEQAQEEPSATVTLLRRRSKPKSSQTARRVERAFRSWVQEHGSYDGLTGALLAQRSGASKSYAGKQLACLRREFDIAKERKAK